MRKNTSFLVGYYFNLLHYSHRQCLTVSLPFNSSNKFLWYKTIFSTFTWRCWQKTIVVILANEQETNHAASLSFQKKNRMKFVYISYNFGRFRNIFRESVTNNIKSIMIFLHPFVITWGDRWEGATSLVHFM